MNVAAVLPYRPRDEDRPLNLATTTVPYKTLGWDIYLGDHEGDPFCRSRAINQAASDALAVKDYDVLLIADSDVLIPDTNQLLNVAQTSLNMDCYTVAFSRLLVLDRKGTEIRRDGGLVSPEGPHVIETLALIWGSAFGISRTLWDRTGGFDERCIGYGSEDLAFLPVANTLGGNPKQRVYGDAWHLAHPENEERDHYADNARIASQYRGCDGDADCIRAILAER